MSGKKFRKNVWKKIQGVKNFGNEGEGRFREILSSPPPQNACCPSNAPQIPRPGAATVDKAYKVMQSLPDSLGVSQS